MLLRPAVFVALTVLLNAGCAKDASSSTGSTMAPSSYSQVSSPAPTKAQAPRLHDPSTNTAKGDWKPTRVGCVVHEVAPTVEEGDPIDDMYVLNACNPAKLPVTQAIATIPKGVTACLAELPDTVAGARVQIRVEEPDFYPYQSYEKRIKR